MVHDRSSLPRSSRVLIKNISQKCSRDDRKMTLGGLHGHGMVQTSEVGPPMVPRGQVIHHQQRCRAQQRVTTTIFRLSRSGEVHLKVLRGGGVEHHLYTQLQYHFEIKNILHLFLYFSFSLFFFTYCIISNWRQRWSTHTRLTNPTLVWQWSARWWSNTQRIIHHATLARTRH